MPPSPMWESIVIVLSVVALWPKVIAPRWAGSDVLMYAALAVMVVVLVRKARRFHKALQVTRKD